MRTNLCVYGAGGHAKVVIDSLFRLDYQVEQIVIFDDDPKKCSQSIFGVKVVSDSSCVCNKVHIAIGDNSIRKELFLRNKAKSPVSVLDKDAVISPLAQLGQGCYVAAGAIVSPDANIERCSIINHGSVVDHDVLVGAFCHIAPNATLLGKVKIGEGSFIGAGSVILPGVSVGRYSTIGAGAVVNTNIPDGCMAVGVPARIIKG